MNLNKSQFWVKLGLFGPQDKEFGSRWVGLVDLIWSYSNNYFTIKVPVFLMTDSVEKLTSNGRVVVVRYWSFEIQMLRGSK